MAVAYTVGPSRARAAVVVVVTGSTITFTNSMSPMTISVSTGTSTNYSDELTTTPDQLSVCTSNWPSNYGTIIYDEAAPPPELPVNWWITSTYYPLPKICLRAIHYWPQARAPPVSFVRGH